MIQLKSVSIVAFSLSFFLASQASFAASYKDLTDEQKELVKQGSLVTLPATLEEDSLESTSFQFIPNCEHEDAAAVFFDFGNYSSYLPGIASAKVEKELGSGALEVSYKFNPIALLSPDVGQHLPSWAYELGAVNYTLRQKMDSHFFGLIGYTLKWASIKTNGSLMPQMTGEMYFEPMKSGILITYQNKTALSFLGIDLKKLAHDWGKETITKSFETFMTQTLQALKDQFLTEMKENPHLLEMQRDALRDFFKKQ